jgi:antitoxin component YwqK of YwqJK toxin-antitoxin module
MLEKHCKSSAQYRKCLQKITLAILIFGFISCKTSLKKVIARNKNGSVAVVFEFPDRSDSLTYFMKIYYPDGKLRSEATIVNAKYTGQIITYFPNGIKYQIDSLVEPCDFKIKACNEILLRYNENGTISQRFTVKNGTLNGYSQHYSNSGVLVKAYYVTNNSIKNGEYEEFFENGKTMLKATYHLDTLVDNEYFFKENGDTLRYFQVQNGHVWFPYTEWLENGNMLNGKFVDDKEKALLWTWYDSNRKEIRRKIEYPKNGVFVKPK